MSVEEAGEEPLAEQAHQERGIPLRHAAEAAVRAHAAVGGEEVQIGVPLEEVSRGGDGDDGAGPRVGCGGAADELGGRFGGGPAELGEEVSATAKQRPQQARDRQHHVAVGYGSEKLLPQPFGPQELLLLLAGGAEAASAALAASVLQTSSGRVSLLAHTPESDVIEPVIG